jgi:hypothetical protein
MQRLAALLALALTAALLAGCAYDPYTGTYVPCCGYYGSPYYGYPNYRYPPPSGPYGYPSGPYMVAPQGQPGGQPGAYPPPAAGQPPGPGAAAYPTGAGVLAQRFATANVTHDGRLTRDQAAVGMPLVAQNFDVIDVDRKGYVTLPEVRTFAMTRRGESGQQGTASPQ